MHKVAGFDLIAGGALAVQERQDRRQDAHADYRPGGNRGRFCGCERALTP